jgi:2-polyprenyl-3-methyl-5-hydroxy-6-metoxy-1,4-benzoquinol methylase
MIGTNVGLYAMAAALLGRQVLAIDAVKQNIQHVCASVEYPESKIPISSMSEIYFPVRIRYCIIN